MWSVHASEMSAFHFRAFETRVIKDTTHGTQSYVAVLQYIVSIMRQAADAEAFSLFLNSFTLHTEMDQ